jgi:hypothetical protein
MKIVFLDIDGVLNAGEGPLLPGCISALNKITNATGAMIVIHSSWRFSWSLVQIRGHLKAHGVEGEIIGVTSMPKCRVHSGILILHDEDYLAWAGSLEVHERPTSIQKWLDVHPEVEAFVILDDDPHFEHLHPKHIHTESKVGLTPQQAEEAILLLS